MEIKECMFSEVEPFLEDLFSQQHQEHFLTNIEESEEQISFGSWEKEQLIGGIVGKRHYQTLHVSLLGVQPAYRNTGTGSRLLKTMEEYAFTHGVDTITLTTKKYQALDFYLKNGYRIFGELENVPMKGTIKYYLVKRRNEWN
ncbi:N-acetyltransferase [Enterococcus florum]|uniref:N-acetyltransferase n=1 Tax=Enterococcus florum TaxID=2480627 RepID=A0A4V0WPX8_9ENTE|nr:GNAT family N-acetyltransferase [Enterococcus florum]GCF95409.1 N-acetyltransferase [Enterococcus florum]